MYMYLAFILFHLLVSGNCCINLNFYEKVRDLFIINLIVYKLTITVPFSPLLIIRF